MNQAPGAGRSALPDLPQGCGFTSVGVAPPLKRRRPPAPPERTHSTRVGPAPTSNLKTMAHDVDALARSARSRMNAEKLPPDVSGETTGSFGLEWLSINNSGFYLANWLHHSRYLSLSGPTTNTFE